MLFIMNTSKFINFYKTSNSPASMTLRSLKSADEFFSLFGSQGIDLFQKYAKQYNCMPLPEESVDDFQARLLIIAEQNRNPVEIAEITVGKSQILWNRRDKAVYRRLEKPIFDKIRAALKQADDTYDTISYGEFSLLLGKRGFTKYYTSTIPYFLEPNESDEFSLWWNNGLFLKAETTLRKARIQTVDLWYEGFADIIDSRENYKRLSKLSDICLVYGGSMQNPNERGDPITYWIHQEVQRGGLFLYLSQLGLGGIGIKTPWTCSAFVQHDLEKLVLSNKERNLEKSDREKLLQERFATLPYQLKQYMGLK
jgi:hypothetical protein